MISPNLRQFDFIVVNSSAEAPERTTISNQGANPIGVLTSCFWCERSGPAFEGIIMSIEGVEVEIETSGHQFFGSIRGKVLGVSTTVESFGGQCFQVPALIMETEKGIDAFSLKRELYSVSVKKVSPDGYSLGKVFFDEDPSSNGSLKECSGYQPDPPKMLFYSK